MAFGIQFHSSSVYGPSWYYRVSARVPIRVHFQGTRVPLRVPTRVYFEGTVGFLQGLYKGSYDGSTRLRNGLAVEGTV